MGRIKKLLDRELVGGTTDEEIYPISSTKAIYDENNQTVDYLLKLYLDKLNKLFARQGYYVCDSISTEPDKEIQVNNFELSTTIRLLVRMSKANLATGVSFEVNTTGAYPLYYNGAPASPENTWEADEVLDIYFDGNFFQAFRSKGSDTGALWELRVDEEGNDYLYTDKNVAIAKGLVTYASIAPLIPSIFDSIPIDNDTIYWYTDPETNERYLKSKGGGGSGIDEKKLWEILGAEGADQIHESHIADILSKYSTTEKMWELLLANTEEQINISHLKTALSEFSSSEELTGKYVTLDSKEQTIQGIKTFLNGLKIGEHLINVVDGVLYLDCSIAVTGGITSFALGDRTPSTIMDGIVVDDTTISKEGGILHIKNGAGGGSDFDESKLWELLESEGIQQIHISHLSNALSGYATIEQLNTKWTQDDVKISHWDEAYSWGDHSLEGYAHLDGEETFTGLKHFTKGLSVGSNKKKIYESNGVVYIDGDVAITGALTTFALGGRNVSSIMDGVVTDNITIRVNPTTKALEVIGGTGGGEADSVEWDNIKNKPTWITTTNPSYTKSESDNKYVTALGTSGNNLTYTKNGTTTPITIPYATNAGTLSGKSLHLSGQNPYGKIPFISGIDGGMEIGKFLDFHTSSDDNRDYAIRLQATNTTGGATITLPSKAGTLALLTDNVTSASKLETARKLWGQSFDGTKDISGNMSGVGTIQLDSSRSTIISPFTSDLTSSEAWYGLTFKWDNSNLKVCLNGYAGISFKTSGGGSHVMSSNGNVGIGTTSPSEKLAINGGILSIQNYSNKVSIGSQNSSFCHIYSSLPFALNNSLYSTSSGDIGNSTYPWNNIFIRGSVSSIKNNSATFGATQMLDYVNSVFSVNVNSYVNKNTCRNILSWCDVINSVGYITRYAIGSIRENSGFGQLYLAVGNNDNGTSLGCALRLDGNTKKVIIKGDLVVQGNVLSEGGVTAYTAGGGSSDAEDFTVKRLNVVGTNNSNAYISADNASNMYFNWGNKTGLVLNANEVRCGLNMNKQISLGSPTAVWKDLYINGLTVNSSPTLSDTNMVGIRTDINNPFIGFRHNSQNWYVQAYTSQLMLGPGSTKSVKIDVNGNMSVYGKVTESSDIRLKTDIKPLANRGYVEPKTFVKDGESCIGFIAQDVKELYPELVTEDSESYLSLSYSQYVAVLQAQIIELNERIKKLEQMNN